MQLCGQYGHPALAVKVSIYRFNLDLSNSLIFCVGSLNSLIMNELYLTLKMSPFSNQNGKNLYPISDKQAKHTQFETKMFKIYTHFQTKTAQNLYNTLWGGIYLYRGVTPGVETPFIPELVYINVYSPVLIHSGFV